MPRVQKDTNKLVSFRVSSRLWDRFSTHAGKEERTASALLRHMMRERLGEVREAEERDAA